MQNKAQGEVIHSAWIQQNVNFSMLFLNNKFQNPGDLKINPIHMSLAELCFPRDMFPKRPLGTRFPSCRRRTVLQRNKYQKGWRWRRAVFVSQEIYYFLCSRLYFGSWGSRWTKTSLSPKGPGILGIWGKKLAPSGCHRPDGYCQCCQKPDPNGASKCQPGIARSRWLFFSPRTWKPAIEMLPGF